MITFRMNDGAGALDAPVDYEQGLSGFSSRPGESLLADDWNGDGLDDVAVASGGSDDDDHDRVSILWGSDN